jgi:universal stress protein A
MVHNQRILLPTDLGSNSAPAVDYAVDLVDKYHAKLFVLHILEFFPASTPDFAVGLALPTFTHESSTQAETQIRSLFNPDWLAGRVVEIATVDGEPAAQITMYAKTQAIDLIVMGTHGHTGVKHMLLGSVAETVLRTASCPVLTVRGGS